MRVLALRAVWVAWAVRAVLGRAWRAEHDCFGALLGQAALLAAVCDRHLEEGFRA